MILINPYNNKHIGRHLLTTILLTIFLLLAVQTATADYVTDNLCLYLNGSTTDSGPYSINTVNHGAVEVQLSSGANALNFPGNGYITIPYDTDMDALTSKSLEIFFMTNNTNEYQFVFDTGYEDLAMGLDIANKALMYKTKNQADTADSIQSVAYAPAWYNKPNSYHHVVLTYDKTTGTKKIYFNTEDAYTKVIEGYGNLHLDQSLNTYIGAYDSTTFLFNGTILYVREYNDVLTADEIVQNYENELWRLRSSYVPEDFKPEISFTESATTVNEADTTVSVNVERTSNSNNVLVQVGDSRTAGNGVTHDGYPGLTGYIYEIMPGWTVTNTGVGGWGVDNIISDYPNSVSPLHPKYAWVEIGINDCSFGRTSAYIEAKIAQYCDMCVSDGITPILVLMPPGNLEVAANTTRTEVNTWMNGYGAANGFYVIDLDLILRNPADHNTLLPAYTTDGIHYSAAGYQAYANAVNTSMINATSVIVSTADGTASAGVDYVASSQKIAFGPGELIKPVIFSIKDNVNDTSVIKYFYVVLSNPSGNASLGVPNNITINIITPAATVTPTPKPYNTHAPGNWLIEFAENLKYLIPCVLIGAIIWFYYSELNNKGRRRR